jgi:hypothetical protein
MNEKNMMTKGAAWKEKSTDMDELKPCPFCGCTQVLVSQRDGVPLIACNECWGENRTIKAWNRREEVTALEAEVERLKANWLGAFLGVVTAAMFAMLSWVALHNPNGSQSLIGMVYGVVMAIVVSLLPCAVSLLQGERVCS